MSKDAYEHQPIEQKWQQRWATDGAFTVPEHSVDQRRGQYILDMFPYPSGDGLHVGHPEGYTATDIYTRFLRMNGERVLHPMGWDAFGLPAENYAIKMGIHPAEVTAKNIANFKRQIQNLGFSYDWTREVNTTDPAYYKWTQWIFLQLFKRGLAYEKEAPIWWCPKDKTGLANEEVINGKCDRCGTAVEKKLLKQWMLKITAYAERLLSGLDQVDWPESIKALQRNWIGKSDGAEIDFRIAPPGNAVLLHGFTGHPEHNFFPRLKTELESAGVTVDVPVLPHTDQPNIPEQIDFVREHCVFNEHTTLLGLSLGTVVALKVAEQLKHPIHRLVLVAGFANPKFRDHARPFEQSFDWTFDWKKIQRNVGSITLLHDINDPAISETQVAELEARLGVTAIRVKAREPHFDAADEPDVLDQLMPKVKVFTTRPDTLFGATYLVLAPEHDVVQSITSSEQAKAVAKYQKSVASKSDLERASLDKEKTGVFTGAYAVNPINHQKIPVWIADYVLSGYGTGAIMAVPAHDERDFAFAEKFNLPVHEVVRQQIGVSGEKKILRKAVRAILLNKEKCLVTFDTHMQEYILPGGGIEEGENPADAIIREIREETGYIDLEMVRDLGVIEHSYYHPLRKNNWQSQVYGFVIRIKSDKQIDRTTEETEKTKNTWLSLSEANQKLSTSPTFGAEKIFIERYLTNACFAGEGIMVNSGEYTGLSSADARERIVSALQGQALAQPKVQYKLRDWVFSRQRYWGEPIPLVHCEHCHQLVESTPHYLNFYSHRIWDNLTSGRKTIEVRALNPEEPERYFGKLKVGDIIRSVFRPTEETAFFRVTKTEHVPSLRALWENAAMMAAVAPTKTFGSLEELTAAFDALAPGYAGKANSNGLVALTLERVIPGVIAVPDDQLPLELPSVEKYEPTGTGESPLAAITDWVNTTCPQCGGPAKRETNTMPQWAGSCWYYLRYCDPKNDQVFASPEAIRAWLPVDMYVGGAEHAVLHLLYSRFWHKVLFDAGHIPAEVGDEPFKKLKNQGLILGPDGEKMSKSRGNVINPDDIVNQYGADTLRMYEMFMGPFEDAKPWDTNGILGVRRFLEKVWRIGQKSQAKDCPLDVVLLTHKTIKKVTEDIESFNFNTAVSSLMILANAFEKLEQRPREEFEYFLLLLEPFAPHIASEILEDLQRGNLKGWPKHDQNLIARIDTVTFAVQVMGKLRATLSMPINASQESVEKAAKDEPNVAKYLTSEPKKVIFVKNKLINFVV